MEWCNSDIERYSSLLLPLLTEKGIIINDLYTLLSSDIDRYIRKDDNIHLTDEAINLCAEQVSEIIKKVAITLDDKKKGKVEKISK